MNLSKEVTLFEVGPRDGLQNEKAFVETKDKINFINLLSQAGFKKIEAASFVSPKWVPQMADGFEVMQGIKRNPDVKYAALTPNLKGYERAYEAGVDEIAIFGSASEGFSQHNINCSIEESLERFEELTNIAIRQDMPIRGYVSCIVECPYDGAVEPEVVARVVDALLGLGCYEVSLGDTVGKAEPEQINTLLELLLQNFDASQLAGHYHDTNGWALDNIKVSLHHGLRTFDSAVGGLGGCPYAPGAKGNVDTLAVHAMLEEEGFSTGLDEETLMHANDMMKSLVKDKQ